MCPIFQASHSGESYLLDGANRLQVKAFLIARHGRFMRNAVIRMIPFDQATMMAAVGHRPLPVEMTAKARAILAALREGKPI